MKNENKKIYAFGNGTTGHWQLSEEAAAENEKKAAEIIENAKAFVSERIAEERALVCDGTHIETSSEYVHRVRLEAWENVLRGIIGAAETYEPYFIVRRWKRFTEEGLRRWFEKYNYAS